MQVKPILTVALAALALATIAAGDASARGPHYRPYRAPLPASGIQNPNLPPLSYRSIPAPVPLSNPNLPPF